MLKQFLYTGFERENLNNLSEMDACQQCSQAITNPVCHDYLGNEIKEWLAFYPKTKKALMPKLKKYVKEVNNDAVKAVRCVCCNRKKAALCPYCFTEGVFHILQKTQTDRNIVGDFLSIFNFDTDHEGYIKEAQEMGMY